MSNFLSPVFVSWIDVLLTPFNWSRSSKFSQYSFSKDENGGCFCSGTAVGFEGGGSAGVFDSVKVSSEDLGSELSVRQCGVSYELEVKSVVVVSIWVSEAGATVA